ncbi:hypothetical protein BDR05DRAFT_569723 [Suillus weaverae]|nr:hypothetical protein BDR05DRAFT_569723 [Suillus weaverae]
MLLRVFLLLVCPVHISLFQCMSSNFVHSCNYGTVPGWSGMGPPHAINILSFRSDFFLLHFVLRESLTRSENTTRQATRVFESALNQLALIARTSKVCIQ